MSERTELDAKHVVDPQPGDYWNEMLHPVALVIDVSEVSVTYLRKRTPVGPDHWTWDTSQVEVRSREDFKKWLSYGSIPGTWASVVPNSRGWKDFAGEVMASNPLRIFIESESRKPAYADAEYTSWSRAASISTEAGKGERHGGFSQVNSMPPPEEGK